LSLAIDFDGLFSYLSMPLVCDLDYDPDVPAGADILSGFRHDPIVRLRPDIRRGGQPSQSATVSFKFNLNYSSNRSSLYGSRR
jgi:hypothetical protein